MLTDTPLPLPVTLIPAATLDPSPPNLRLAAGGVVLTNCPDAATAYPDLWRSREPAKKALQRGADNPVFRYISYTGMSPTSEGGGLPEGRGRTVRGEGLL